MDDYKKIFLIVDPSRRETPAFRRAVQLARGSGAHLHLGLFDGPALSPIGHIDEAVAERVRRAFQHDRETWLDAVARKLTADGIFTSSEVDLRTPVQEIIVTRVLEEGSDLVLKDVEHQHALSRILFTPLDWQLARLCPAPLLLVNSRDVPSPRRVIMAVDTLNAFAGASDLNDRIVAEARRVAGRLGGELHLVHAVTVLPTMSGSAVEGIAGIATAWAQLAQLDGERFDTFAQRHQVPADRRHFLTGPPAHTIAAFATDPADLIVIGTTYRRGLDRLLIGSTAESVLGLAHCDVLVVQPEGFRADVARYLGLAPANRRAA